MCTFALFGMPHMSEGYKFYVLPYAAPYILPTLQTVLTISVYATGHSFSETLVKAALSQKDFFSNRNAHFFTKFHNA